MFDCKFLINNYVRDELIFSSMIISSSFIFSIFSISPLFIVCVWYIEFVNKKRISKL